MRTDQRNGLRSKAGFALLEVVMTIIIVGMALGTAAMVLGTAVKVVQMRTAQNNRSLAAENCMARIEAAFQGLPLTKLDVVGAAASVCQSGVEVSVWSMTIEEVGKDSENRTKYLVKPDTSTDKPFRLVTVKADSHTYRRLFSYPQLNATSGLPVLSASKGTTEGE